MSKKTPKSIKVVIVGMWELFNELDSGKTQIVRLFEDREGGIAVAPAG